MRLSLWSRCADPGLELQKLLLKQQVLLLEILELEAVEDFVVEAVELVGHRADFICVLDDTRICLPDLALRYVGQVD